MPNFLYQGRLFSKTVRCKVSRFYLNVLFLSFHLPVNEIPNNFERQSQSGKPKSITNINGTCGYVHGRGPK